VVLIYLTLDGKAPSGNSLSNLEQENVRCLSFADDIRGWIGHCANLSIHKPELSYALIQYKRLIETLTGAGASMISLIADNLSNNREDFETALAVERALPKAKAAVMRRFWEGLSTALGNVLDEKPVVYGAKNLKAISDRYFDSSRGGKNVGIKHAIGEFNGEKLCLYVNIYKAMHYGLRIENASGSPVSRPEAKARIREKLNEGNAVADKDADWLVCYYHSPSSSQEPVVLNFHSFSGLVLNLLDENNRQTIINRMVDHQVLLVEEAKSLIKAVGA
jgi:hypothetical protein